MLINTINGAKYTWQVFNFRANVTTYCADGDGFIEVRTCGNAIGLYDQNQRVRTFHADNLTDALALAEQYADAVYPTMLDAYAI